MLDIDWSFCWKIDGGVFDGYPFLITGSPLGYRSGYIAVPPGHPWHGLTWYEDVVVHGGLSYVGLDALGTRWWLGFSCNGQGDAPDPALCQIPGAVVTKPGQVRGTLFVRKEIESLIAQAKTACQPDSDLIG